MQPEFHPLHHIALGARDVAKVARFYQRAFGLAAVQEHRFEDGSLRSIWLGLGASVLMIEKTSEPARPVEGVGPGPFLLAFRMSAESRNALTERLSSLGAAVEDETEATFYARDPEGNRIAFSSYELPSAPADSRP